MATNTATCKNGEISIKTIYSRRFVEDLKTTFKKVTWESGTNRWILYAWDVNKMALYAFLERWKIGKEPSFGKDFDTSILKREFFFEKARAAELGSSFEYEKPDSASVYPHQECALKLLMENDGNMLISDDMGLGKTCESLLFARNQKKYPFVVFCPAITKANWRKEISFWADVKVDDVAVIEGKTPVSADFLRSKVSTVINYQVVEAHTDELEDARYKLAIIDETQNIANPKAKQTKATLNIVEDIPCVVAMSGTPMINRPIDLYTTLRAIKKNTGDFTFWNYVNRYCGAVQTKYGWKFDGATNLAELNEKLLKGIMIRRKKEDVLKELPPKNRKYFYIEMPEKVSTLYAEIRKDFSIYYNAVRGNSSEKFTAEKFTMIEKLKKIAIDGKKSKVVDFVLKTHSAVKKLIVYGHHIYFLDFLEKRLNESSIKTYRIDGETPQKDRDSNIEEFNTSSNCVLVCGIKCASTGLNLQTCNTIIFAELTWTPSDHLQAEDRIYRIGQKRRCDIYYLIAEGTIEEKVYNVICRKDKVIKKAIDDE